MSSWSYGIGVLLVHINIGIHVLGFFYQVVRNDCIAVLFMDIGFAAGLLAVALS